MSYVDNPPTKDEVIAIDFGDWHAGNNGTGKRRWFVCRTEKGTRFPRMEWAHNPSGDLKRFGSFETAEKFAQRLNNQEK